MPGVQKYYSTKAVCEFEAFSNFKRILSNSNSTEFYNLKITNILNHKYYHVKFITKATQEDYTFLCQQLQNAGLIILDCIDLVFNAYLLKISGNLPDCVDIQEELLQNLLEYGAIPLKTELESVDLCTADLKILTSSKNPLHSISFMDLMRRNGDLKYSVTPTNSSEFE
ncbi:hypothetical protein [Methanococcus voltae]|jgi:hypothetical protein|uniref:Uncharacterized protein n=2 Tax=Methanococcus voltae TaxID=2188 RepID=A0A8J7UUB0_METVO|nr:hypothetical protein [Methanococcus voltae]MBP2171924.1 hypothetical protein [Methanococcus voltae]MBP2201121.1 hypothetical protein [Methanococcus voltae]MCS3921844.1 hypothetical protein [Methanococcus voltae PS]